MVNVYINILNGIMDVYGLIIFNNLNFIIRRFILIIIILMVFILIVSFYGMNVLILFMDSGFIVYGIIIVFVFSSLLVVWYF